MPEPVFVRDLSSGKVHVRFRTSEKGPLASFEGDNADEAGEFEEITAALVEGSDPDALCRRCFGAAHPEGVE